MSNGRVSIKVEGQKGTWHVIDVKKIGCNNYYLLEPETYGDESPCICIREDGSLVLEDIFNVYDVVVEYLKNKEVNTKYTFYSFVNEKFYKDMELLANVQLYDAIKIYKLINTKSYKALGVTKDGMFSCDLLNNKGENGSDKISEDYTKLEHFKDDEFITKKIIPFLKLQFNLYV